MYDREWLEPCVAKLPDESQAEEEMHEKLVITEMLGRCRSRAKK